MFNACGITEIDVFLSSLQAESLTQYYGGLPDELKFKLRDTDTSKGANNCFLVKTNWTTHKQVILYFPPAYPHCLPQIYLPHHSKDLVIPHIDHRGFVCIYPPETTVNPYVSPLTVLTQMLDEVGALLGKTYSEEQLSDEVKNEILAYWTRCQNKHLIFNSREFANDNVFLVHQVKREGDPREIFVAQKFEPKAAESCLDHSKEKELGIGFLIKIPERRHLDLIKNPEKLADEFGNLTSLFGKINQFLSQIKKPIKRVRLFPIFIIDIGGENIFLGAYFKNPIIIKKSDFIESAKSFFSSPYSSPILERLDTQDIATKRLMRRSKGYIGENIPDTLKVAVVGCGSLGSFLIEALLRSGVTQFLLADSDILQPENLARHVLRINQLYDNKASGMARYIHERFIETNIEVYPEDVRSSKFLDKIQTWKPDFIISTTGDSNADFFLSDHCCDKQLPHCFFTWVEPNLCGGHLIFQPSAADFRLRDWHSIEENGYYKWRFINDPSKQSQRERGCQSIFTPYSGTDMIEFATKCAKKILSMVISPPPTNVALRLNFSSHDSWEDAFKSE